MKRRDPSIVLSGSFLLAPGTSRCYIYLLVTGVESPFTLPGARPHHARLSVLCRGARRRGCVTGEGGARYRCGEARCVPRAYVFPRKSLTLTFHPTARVNKELVVTAPEFDDPNIDPDAVPLGEYRIIYAIKHGA